MIFLLLVCCCSQVRTSHYLSVFNTLRAWVAKTFSMCEAF
uniref:Uncharacterized protein n=1 Tax=Anguilla anguilla TaxID=7936 RepID=A0A0E9X8S5_ANGAN